MEQILQEAKKSGGRSGGGGRQNGQGLFFDQEKQVFDKGADGDLVTHVDHLMEDDILRRIAASFPDHQIRSEETGWSGVEGDWLWLVDPLDGTNNYAVGLPVYGVAITLLYRKNPVLGVIHDSHLEQTYVAVQGEGAVCGGQPIAVKPARNPHRLTIGWIQGHHVQKRDSAMRLKQSLDLHCKRVLRLWPLLCFGAWQPAETSTVSSCTIRKATTSTRAFLW